MLKKWRRKILSGCALTLVISSYVHAGTTITAAVPVPADSIWGEVFSQYVDTVKEVSDGDLNIRIVGPESIPAREQIRALRTGLIDILSTFPGAYRSEFPEANVQEISNVSLEEQKKNGSYDKLKDVFNKRFDAELLSTYGQGVGFHIYLSKEIKEQSDLKGMRIRTSVLQQPLLRALNTQLIDIPIPDVFTALERKMVDGYSFSSLGIHDMGWDGMTKYRVDPSFYNVIFNVLLSNKSKSKLTEQQLGYLRTAAEKFETAISAHLASETAKEYQRQKDIGIKSVDLGDSYDEMAREVYWNELTYSSDFAKELKALMNK